MQLFAINRDGKSVSARDAIKQMDYVCFECKGKLRVRGGLHRQPHFFHYEVSSNCRQSRKSAEHLATQLVLVKLISDCQMERPFQEIGRIADVCWEEKKIIFEVQCSPISADEIVQRNKDYASIGYQVVWILHEKRFNRLNISEAELFLSRRPYYFTNINGEGKGRIYDQLHWIDGVTRARVLGRRGVLIAEPRTPGEKHKKKLQTLERDKWGVYFAGDYLDALIQGERLPMRFRKCRLLEWGAAFKKYYLQFIEVLISRL